MQPLTFLSGGILAAGRTLRAPKKSEVTGAGGAGKLLRRSGRKRDRKEEKGEEEHKKDDHEAEPIAVEEPAAEELEELEITPNSTFATVGFYSGNLQSPALNLAWLFDPPQNLVPTPLLPHHSTGLLKGRSVDNAFASYDVVVNTDPHDLRVTFFCEEEYNVPEGLGYPGDRCIPLYISLLGLEVTIVSCEILHPN